MTEMHVPRPYVTILSRFLADGGVGDLDAFGHVLTGPTKTINSGDPTTWLKMVSLGLVAGSDGKMRITEYGREVVQHRAAARGAA